MNDSTLPMTDGQETTDVGGVAWELSEAIRLMGEATASGVVIDRVAGWYERYAVELLGYIRQQTGGHIDAEDILSRVFLEAIRYEAGLNDAPRPWLYLVARSRVTDWRRHEGRHATLPLDEYAVSGIEDAVIDRLWIQSLFAGLKPRYRDILQLRYIYGYSIDESADRLGISPFAVKALTHRACAAVQQAAPGSSR